MSEKKIGRPKHKQTKPIIFERTQGRVERMVTMSPQIAAQLDRYVTWAAAQVGAKPEEAMTLAIDQALAALFQRDQLFRESGDATTERGPEGSTETGKESAPKASAPASSSPPPRSSLPPPPAHSRPGGPS